MAKLTDIAVRALKPPPKGQKTYCDENGLGIRISQGGTKTWVLVHGSQRERITIGRYPIISLQEARAAAKNFLAEKTLGKRDNPTFRFEESLAVFLETQTERLRQSTKRNYTRMLKSHFEKPLRGKPLTEIQTHHLTAIIDKLHKTPRRITVFQSHAVSFVGLLPAGTSPTRHWRAWASHQNPFPRTGTFARGIERSLEQVG